MVQMLNFMVYVFYHNLKNISIGNRKKERVRGRERKEGNNINGVGKIRLERA